MRDEINPLFDYAEAHSGPVPDYLQSLERQTFLQTLAPQMMCSHLQGRLLSLLSKLLRPQRILELGTFTGYSALCLAEGLPQDGKLYTIEGNPEVALIAQRAFDASPFASQIELLQGDVFEQINLLEGDFDLLFFDAKKKDYQRYFDALFPRLRSGGLLISDNVTWDGRVANPEDGAAQATGLPAFNQFLAQHEELDTVLVPFRDGLSVCRRK